MTKNIFIARYKDDKGITRTVAFDKSKYNQEEAEKWLNAKEIKNFLWFFEPYAPEPFGENGMLFKGDVGFDITAEALIPHIKEGKDIILDTFGGDLWEGWKIYDAIKLLNLNPSIGVLGTCASSGMQILLASENRWSTANSRGLIHNPWTFEVGDDEVMKNTASQLEQEKLQLAKLYSRVSGNSEEEMLSLMKKEIFLNADQMLSYNFIKEIKGNYAKQQSKTDNSKIDMKNKDEKNKEVKNKLNSIGSLFNELKDLFSSPKNIVIQDVNGVEIDFPTIETADQIAVDLEATVDGAAAAGEFVLEDGRTLVFEAGILTEIKEPESNDEIEDLQQENADLKAENERLATEAEASNNALGAKEAEFNQFKADAEAKFAGIKAEFDELKKLSSDGYTAGNDSSESGEGNSQGKKARSAFKKK